MKWSRKEVPKGKGGIELVATAGDTNLRQVLVVGRRWGGSVGPTH